MSSARVLVAGIGNIFLGDDGFGVEVVRRLREVPVDPEVRVLDAGVRMVHLVYEMLGGGYETAILVDTVSRGAAPGTLYVLEPHTPTGSVAMDGHGMRLEGALSMLRSLGGTPGRVLIVGCEAGAIDELGFSAPVEAAIDPAVNLVQKLVGEALRTIPAAVEG